MNPGGQLHDIVTASTVDPATWCYGSPTCENSWFPGYAWTTASCRTCRQHIGWRFDLVTSLDAVASSEHTLKAAAIAISAGWPTRFWGLTRNSIVCQAPAYDKLLAEHRELHAEYAAQYHHVLKNLI